MKKCFCIVIVVTVTQIQKMEHQILVSWLGYQLYAIWLITQTALCQLHPLPVTVLEHWWAQQCSSAEQGVGPLGGPGSLRLEVLKAKFG